MKRPVKEILTAPGGPAHLMKVAVPLILSASVFNIQLFVDRMFLMWYDTDAISAGMQAGIASFTIIALLSGIASYTNTFVAQYMGAKRPHRVGPSLWQGLWFSLFSGSAVLLLIPFSDHIFQLIGHAPKIRQFETDYFKIMCINAIPGLISSTASCFYTGRGKTWPVLWVSTVTCVINLALDYPLIFGKFGFSAMGIKGAAWATVISSACSAVIYIALFLNAENDRAFNTRTAFRIEKQLFKRLIRFGGPAGFTFMLDIMAFGLFIAIVGKLGSDAFAATTVAFQINTIGFLPPVGLGFAVTVLVGQALGADKPPQAVRTTKWALVISSLYTGSMSLLYISIPKILMLPFASGADPQQFELIEPIAAKLLIFVAIYCVFDAGNIIFSAALKGAGDTRFIMIVSLTLSWLIMVIPSAAAVYFKLNIYIPWAFATAYVCILAVIFMLRFADGKWKNMRVIEPHLPPVAVTTQAPATEPDIPA